MPSFPLSRRTRKTLAPSLRTISIILATFCHNLQSSPSTYHNPFWSAARFVLNPRDQRTSRSRARILTLVAEIDELKGRSKAMGSPCLKSSPACGESDSHIASVDSSRTELNVVCFPSLVKRIGDQQGYRNLNHNSVHTEGASGGLEGRNTFRFNERSRFWPEITETALFSGAVVVQQVS